MILQLFSAVSQNAMSMFWLGVCTAMSAFALYATLRALIVPSDADVLQHQRTHVASLSSAAVAITVWLSMLLALAFKAPGWVVLASAFVVAVAIASWWTIRGARVWLVRDCIHVTSPLQVNVGDHIVARRGDHAVVCVVSGVSEQFESTTFEFDTERGMISSSAGWVFIAAWREGRETGRN